MPRQKNFKKLVRDRMVKTGESYTAARAHFEPPGPKLVGDPTATAMVRALTGAGLVNPVTGLNFSAELLFGLGGGIGFAYLVFVYPGWTSTNLDGRYNTLYFEKKSFFETVSARLGLPLRVRPTAKPDLTERYLRQALSTASEVAMTLDLVRLPGRRPDSAEVPYCPHTVTVSGDRELTVTGLPAGRITMGWDELIEARWTHAKKYGGLFVFGPPTEPVDLRAAVWAAIGRTAECLLEPARSSFDSSFGVPGMRKWCELLTEPRDRRGWPKLFAEPDALRQAMTAIVSGLADDGAARRLYAAFLDEAADLLAEPELAGIADTYRTVAGSWTALVELAGRAETTPVDLATHLPDLADAERAAAVALRGLCIGARQSA